MLRVMPEDSVFAHLKKGTLKKYGAFYGDPQHMFSQTAQSPKTIAQQLQECGFSFSPWPRTGGQEEALVEEVRRLLGTMDGAGFPKLQVFRNCENTIREFQSWSYKRTAHGDLPPGADKFEDKDNHAMDVVKGVIATHPHFANEACFSFSRRDFDDDDDDDCFRRQSPSHRM
jgi:hypothetical protein